MTGIIFLVLAGLVALGFLFVVGRRREMPGPLRAMLVIGAVVIFVYVAWTVAQLLRAGPG